MTPLRNIEIILRQLDIFHLDSLAGTGRCEMKSITKRIGENMKIESGIVLQNQVHQLNKGHYIFYDGTIDGEPCFCMADNKNAEKIIMDKSDVVLEKIKRIKGIHCRSGQDNEYSVVIDGREITLRRYLSKIYIGNDTERNVQHTYIKDNHLANDGVWDLRSRNIGYYFKKDFNITILQRPKEPDEKYIALTYGGVTEVFYYTDKVYNWLTGGGLYLSIGDATKSSPGRLKTKGVPLSRVVYELLNEDVAAGYECAHIHSGFRWINSLYNLMPMQKETNNSMTDLASRIGGGVKMNAIVCDYPHGSHKILVECFVMKLPPIYLVCDTPELYLDLQKQIMGKTKLTQNLKLFWNGEKVNTPKTEYEMTKKKHNHFEDKVKHLWSWCDARDRILSAYTNTPDYFIPWTGDINDVFRALIRRGWIKMVGVCRESEEK